MSEPDFRSLFEAVPGLYLVLSPDLVILAASDAYLRATMTRRHEVLGRWLFEVFPDNPNDQSATGVTNLKASLDQVIVKKVADRMPVQRYDIRRRPEDNGDFEERFWSPVNTPVIVNGKLAYILHQVEDVTEIHRLEQCQAQHREVELALRESQEWFSTTLRSIADGVIATDRDRNVIFMNPVAEQVTGWPLTEARGKPVFNVFQVLEAETNCTLRPVQGAMVQGQTIPAPKAAILLTRSGSKVPIEDSVAPIRSAKGSIVGSVIVFRDVTERRCTDQALRRSERLYRAIGESIDYGVWVCDPNGRNIYASESFLKLVGLTQEQCSAFGWKDVLHPDDADRTIAAWKTCVRSGDAWDVEHRYRGADGKWHPVLARGVPVKDDNGEISCWVGINLDIARLKQAEDELKTANQSKDEFLAMLAHELRNPLSPLKNAVQILGSRGDDPPTVETVRQMIDRQVHHMVRIVDDLLDVSRISRGKVSLKCERLDLARLVLLAAEDNRKSIQQAGLALFLEIPETPVWASGDPTRLAQVMDNLLQNARKFTEKGGEIRVSVADAADGYNAIVWVRDTGIGIEPELLPRLFEPFAQGDRSLARSRGGLGLGLALVKNLVEMHGGMVAASSAGLGRGAEFALTFPRTKEPAALEPKHATPAPKGNQLQRILVVEDNLDSAESLRMLLELFGYEVTVAHTGPDGLKAAQRGMPETVICDIGLPGMDGFAVAAALRKDPRMASARLIALTGYGSAEDTRRSSEAGFDEHLVKPVDPDKLLQHLRRRNPSPN